MTVNGNVDSWGAPASTAMQAASRITSTTAVAIMPVLLFVVFIAVPPYTLSVTFSPNRPVGFTHSTTISRAKVNASEKVV